MTDTTEIEILNARRAFPKAQTLLAGLPTGDFTGVADIGWHHVGLHPEVGSFALADLGGPFDDERFIGEVLQVSTDRGDSVFVYLVGRADIEGDLSLCRRAYLSILPLKIERATVTVAVVT